LKTSIDKLNQKMKKKLMF